MSIYKSNFDYSLGNLEHSFGKKQIGKGGLGYKPSKVIIGGMAFRNIDNPSEIDDENIERLKSQGISNYDQLLESVIDSNKISNDDKVKFYVEQLSDLSILEEKNNEQSKDRELKKNIERYKLEIQKILDSNLEEEYLSFLEKNPEIEPEENEFYNRNEQEANEAIKPKTKDSIEKKNEERGNIFEDDAYTYDDENKILRNLDKDMTEAYNTKDLDPYTDHFLNYIIKILNIDKPIDQLDNDDYKSIVENFLQYIPIDIVKDKTLWELKSFRDNIKSNNSLGSQTMGLTKLNKSPVFNPSTKVKYGDIKFIYNKDDGKWKVENLYFVNDKIMFPIFKNSNFNYYWMFNNKDYIGYYNPLINKNFNPQEIINKNKKKENKN